MLDRIKSLLAQAGYRHEAAHPRFADRDVAVGALLIEAASSDGNYGEAEHVTLRDLVMRKLKLAADDANALLEAARLRQRDAVEIFSFTNAAKAGMNEDERIALVEMLWEVVYADGVLDEYEDRLIRTIAALLHVPDRARAEARQRVLTRRSSGT
ncbi:MAG: TerB family tellurite resistance protein [Alphaproteobacteria bacterium]|nr:TerB family tellurite resistance protein [Alphaproteobacteria bacterium]